MKIKTTNAKRYPKHACGEQILPLHRGK